MPDFFAGAPLMASDLQAMSDAIELLSVDFVSYSTTWAASAGTPSIGNGTLTARQRTVGSLVHVEITLVAGSTTNVGTAGAYWLFTVPYAAAGQAQGTVAILDSGVNEWAGVARISGGTSHIELFKTQSGGRLVNNSPMASLFASGDSMGVSIWYRRTV